MAAAVGPCGAPTAVSTTAFQFDPSDRIVLPVQVDGAPHTFVLDTSTRSTISAGLARALNRPVRTNRHGERTVDDVSVELLGVSLPHQVLYVSNEPMSYDGVVGAELCSRFVVRVDLDARRIVLWERSVAIDARHAEILPADFSADVPVIKARIRAAGVNPADAALIVGLAEPPGTVSFTYRYAADAGLLDASINGTLPIEIGGVTTSPLSAVARLPREPDQKLLFADGIVSARALTRSWIVFDAPRARIVIGR
ncbi:MAG TPA: hypothetical protein VF159_01850 [Gemmatimonadaceae bacterium]